MMTGTFVPIKDDEQVLQAATLAAEIWRECYSGTLAPAQIEYMLANIQSAEAISRQIKNENYRYFFVHGSNGTAPCGYIALQAEAGKMLLSKLYILSRHRGEGLAKQCTAFAEDLAKKEGCTHLWLTVNKYNARAIAAYEKMGFKNVRSQVADIGGGYVMDDYVFEKEL